MILQSAVKQMHHNARCIDKNKPGGIDQRVFNRLSVVQLIFWIWRWQHECGEEKGSLQHCCCSRWLFAPRKNMREVNNLLVSNQPRHASQLWGRLYTIDSYQNISQLC